MLMNVLVSITLLDITPTPDHQKGIRSMDASQASTAIENRSWSATIAAGGQCTSSHAAPDTCDYVAWWFGGMFQASCFPTVVEVPRLFARQQSFSGIIQWRSNVWGCLPLMMLWASWNDSNCSLGAAQPLLHAA